MRPGSKEFEVFPKKSKKWITLIIFACFRFSWRHQLREFKSEFRVVAIDMRGYGESDLPLSAENYRFDYLITDVKDIVEYLGERKELCVSVVLQKSTQHFDKNQLVYHSQIVASLWACSMVWQTSSDSLWLNMGQGAGTGPSQGPETAC